MEKKWRDSWMWGPNAREQRAAAFAQKQAWLKKVSGRKY